MSEAWLHGPVEGVPALLQPVAHSLTDACEEVEAAASGLEPERLWARPGGVASVGFHLRHMRGALDRLFTYARGEALDAGQLAALRAEAEPGDPPAAADALLDDLRRRTGDAIETLRGLDVDTLPEPRAVGRAALPSTVLGLLFHAAEHGRRHAGQVIATAQVVRSAPRSEGGVEVAPAGGVGDARAGEPAEAARASLLRTARDAFVEAAIRAWEDAGVRGLCGEGRFEAAMGAVRTLDGPAPDDDGASSGERSA